MRQVPIIAVYDNLLGYKNISIEQNEAVAKRAFTNSLVYILESGDFNAVNPADLSLYCVGKFDMDTGDIEVCTPSPIVHGTTIITEWNISRCRCDNPCLSEEDVKVGDADDL